MQVVEKQPLRVVEADQRNNVVKLWIILCLHVNSEGDWMSSGCSISKPAHKSWRLRLLGRPKRPLLNRKAEFLHDINCGTAAAAT